jgi:hypothetical protein
VSKILNREAYRDAAWDLDWLEPECDNKIMPSDIDKVLERRGKFLTFETKRSGQLIPTGQRLLFDALVRKPGWTHLVLWGDPDEPERMQVWPREPEPAGRDEVRAFVRRWWLEANG